MVKQQRIEDYSTTVASNTWESVGYTWGLFFTCYLLASLLNPYFWKLFSDGFIGLNLWGLFFYSLIFAIVVAAISTIPAYMLNFNYNDVDCYPYDKDSWGYFFAFWQWQIMPWNWGKEDAGCVERRKTFGNISTVIGVLVIILYYIYDYGIVYGNYKFPLGGRNKTV